ncbi:hypothetical protein GALMADRAFT_147647 [Galerina marginata CBS 339.88]|uniref:Uncharacterized protein n=1 Tax=Galerina marginata (strain CBS 339.88) TaxID=685588 RepID=A0A067SJ30_GALM3|nr:hypothetical protein GALMADRAFT_147647 [Galerina marginata CBS 339.88]
MPLCVRTSIFQVALAGLPAYSPARAREQARPCAARSPASLYLGPLPVLGQLQSTSTMLSVLEPAGNMDREVGSAKMMERKGERSKIIAASFIKAYMLEERELEELERVVWMGEVSDDHVNLDVGALAQLRLRSMDKARRILGDDVDFAGTWRGASQ